MGQFTRSPTQTSVIEMSRHRQLWNALAQFGEPGRHALPGPSGRWMGRKIVSWELDLWSRPCRGSRLTRRLATERQDRTAGSSPSARQACPGSGSSRWLGHRHRHRHRSPRRPAGLRRPSPRSPINAPEPARPRVLWPHPASALDGIVSATSLARRRLSRWGFLPRTNRGGAPRHCIQGRSPRHMLLLHTIDTIEYFLVFSW